MNAETPEQFFQELRNEACFQETEEIDPSLSGHARKAARHAHDWHLLRLRERGFTLRQIGAMTGGRNAATIGTQVFSALVRSNWAREARWQEMAKVELPSWRQR